MAFDDVGSLLWRRLQSLPYELKILCEVLLDTQMTVASRTVSAGGLFYILDPIDIIPDNLPVIGYVDDVIVLRLVLELVMEGSPSRAGYYRERYPEVFEGLQEELETLKQFLGGIYTWLQAMVRELSAKTHNGKTAEQYASDEQAQEALYDEAMVHAANYRVSSAEVEKRLGRLDRVLPYFERKMLEDGGDEGGVATSPSEADGQ